MQPVSYALDAAPAKTAADLDWPRVLQALAARCTTPFGAAHVHNTPFADSATEVRARLEEWAEAELLRAKSAALPLRTCADIRATLLRLRSGTTLGPEDFRDILDTASLARATAQHLALQRAHAPRLSAACRRDAELDAAEAQIRRAFDSDGTLADSASAKLATLREQRRAARERILQRLDEVMRKYEHVLQDTFVTEREGRYVLPVRSDAHERFPGIVHASSASGATLFVEPRVILPLGNRLKVLEGEVEREELLIYAQLSADLLDVLPNLLAATGALGLADARHAATQLAADLALGSFVLVDTPQMDLRGARHPLLALDGVDVIPSDLLVESGRAMIVSGPNAGGKTVGLKTLGLCALMARFGLPLPVAPDSRVGLFDRVLTDVGDEQSLQKNLSTFSAHVRNLARVIEHTGERTLVLLDELAGGTDPREGEALAVGILDALCKQGGAIVATTHYEGLKAMALGDARFANASVGFDRDKLAPTFLMQLGVPGASSALEVARKFGLPAAVIERAERFLSREDRTFEELVRRMNDERAALELAREDLQRKAAIAEAREAELQTAIEALKERARAKAAEEADSVLVAIRRARESLRELQAELRAKNPSREQAGEIGKRLDTLQREVAAHARDLLPPQATRAKLPEALRVGTRVFITRIRMNGEVLELLSDGKIRVAAGPLKLVVGQHELGAADTAADPHNRKSASKQLGAKPASGARQNAASPVSASAPVPRQSADNTCDVRGLQRVDAVSLATTFLDRAHGELLRVAFLLHGQGASAVRDALHAELQASASVAHFRSGGAHEGGEAVTVVWLR